MTCKIYSNYHWRKFVYGHDLSQEEKDYFDWLDDIDSQDFIRYKDRVYHLSEFEKSVHFGQPWQGYHGDSFFSGIVVAVNENMYIIGTYIC